MKRGVALLVLMTASSPLVEAGAPRWIREPIPAADPTSLAFDTHVRGLVLAGTSSGQLYRSEDGGETWAMPAGDLPFPGHVVAELVADPAIPRRFYAALWRLWGEGGGLVRSDDGGESWSPLPGLPDAAFRAVAVAPGAPYVLLAGGAEGVWQSTDTGRTFARLTPDTPEWSRVESLAIDPRTPLRLYAGTWRRAYRSDDGGRAWTTIWRGMVEDSDVFDLLVEPSLPDGVCAATCGWVYRSADRGGAWTRLQEGFIDRRIHGLSRGADGSLMAASCGGVHLSEDDGASWRPVGLPCETIAAVAHDPFDPQRVLAAAEADGIHLSEDAGRTWVRSSRGLAGAHVFGARALDDETLLAEVRRGHASTIWKRKPGEAWLETELETLPPGPLCTAEPIPSPIRGLPIRQVCPGARDERLVLTASCGFYRALPEPRSVASAPAASTAR